MLPFYDDVKILRKKRAFKSYVESYEVETIDNKSLNDSLLWTKDRVKGLFNDLLREKWEFKYILSTKIALNRRINNNETKYVTVYFDSIAKTITNQRYPLNDSFEEILNKQDIWINEGSGWAIYPIDGLHNNSSNYEPLSGSSYIQLPENLRNSDKKL